MGLQIRVCKREEIDDFVSIIANGSSVSSRKTLMRGEYEQASEAFSVVFTDLRDGKSVFYMQEMYYPCLCCMHTNILSGGARGGLEPSC